jgi:hypothetical protein
VRAISTSPSAPALQDFRASPSEASEPGFSSRRVEWLNRFCYDWLLRGCKRTFSPFHRGVVTTYALEVDAAGEGDNRDHSFSAFRAVRRPIHEILPISAPLTRNWNFCSIRAFRRNRRIPWQLLWSRRGRQVFPAPCIRLALEDVAADRDCLVELAARYAGRRRAEVILNSTWPPAHPRLQYGAGVALRILTRVPVSDIRNVTAGQKRAYEPVTASSCVAS